MKICILGVLVWNRNELSMPNLSDSASVWTNWKGNLSIEMGW